MLWKNKYISNNYLIIAIISFTSLISAFLFEYLGGFEPCFLCWTQRAVFFLLGVFALIAHFSRYKILLYVLASLILAGCAFSLRHIYVILNPTDVMCGVTPSVAFDFLPFSEALKHFLTGGPSCSSSDGVFGIPFPYWSLVLYLSCLLLLFKPNRFN